MGMLEGKVAIITGATSGIGRRTAELFVEEGARVVFTGRRRAEGESLAAALGKSGRFIQADATLEEDWKGVIGETLSAYGRVDAVFNNAGGPAPTGSITSIPVDKFDAAMALLVRSVMLGIKHALSRRPPFDQSKPIRHGRTTRHQLIPNVKIANFCLGSTASDS